MHRKFFNKSEINIIAIIVFVQICSFLFIGFYPAKALEENLLFIFTLNGCFIFIIFVVAVLVRRILSIYQVKKRKNKFSGQYIPKSIILMSILPVIGLTFLVIDRVFIRGIDYSKELRAARYEWLASEGGTFFGIVGTIIIHIAYPSIFFAIRNASLLKTKQLLSLITTSIIAILGISVLNGGRSGILFLLITTIIAISIRAKSQEPRAKSQEPRANTASTPIFKNRLVLFIAPILCISIYYVFKVIESSAALGQLDLARILIISIPQMYGVPDEDFFLRSHSDITYLILYSLAYLFHSQWTTQSTYSLSDTPGYYSVISMPTMYLDKLGIIDIGAENVLFYNEGLFLSLPGGIYYDFKWQGIVIAAIVIGIFFGITLFWLSRLGRFDFFKIMIILSVLYFLILSPSLAAYGLGHYFFIIFSFALMGMLSKIIFNEKIYY